MSADRWGGYVKFSEAIRLGSMMKPQAFGEFNGTRVKWRSNGPLGLSIEEPATCALQAAYDSAGITESSIEIPVGTLVSLRDGTSHILETNETQRQVAVPREWYELLTQVRDCPSCGAPGLFVHTLVSHLNDVHRWTREWIANWVEVQERTLTDIDHATETGARGFED